MGTTGGWVNFFMKKFRKLGFIRVRVVNLKSIVHLIVGQ